MTIALVGREDSRWLRAVEDRCGRECAVLELESVLRGGALTVAEGRVDWDGFALHEADAVLVERAIFAWPQPGVGREGLSPHGEREARALLQSALLCAAQSVPVLEDPRLAHLAIAPALGLERCARAGCAVHPWSLVSHRPDGDERLWSDPGGRELRYEPRAPQVGGPALAPEPFEGEVSELLVVDGQVLAARRYGDPLAWRAAEPEALVPAPEIPAGAAQAAVAAQRALGLAWVEVALRDVRADYTLLHLVPDSDLGRWDGEFSGTISDAIAALLESRTAIPR